MSTFLSLHAAVRDETRRQAAVADILRGRRHTRDTVANQLAQPATGQPPIYQAVQSSLTGKEADRG